MRKILSFTLPAILVGVIVYSSAQAYIYNPQTSTSSASSTGSGSVSTSSAVSTFNFPYWATSSGLAGTSTMTYASSTGSIGLGTTTPTAYLSTTPLYVSNTNVVTQAQTSIAVDNGGGSVLQIGFIASTTNQSGIIDVNGTGELLFRTAGTINTGVTRIKIQTGGDILLGNVTGVPTYPGNVTVSSTLVGSATKSLFSLGGSAISGGNANGTLLGSNQVTGFTGDFLNLQVNSSSIVQINSSTSAFQNTVTVNTTNAVSTSGLEMLLGDTSSSLNYPWTFSHKPGASSGSLSVFGVNMYINPSGLPTIVNTSTNAWAIEKDSRNGASSTALLFAQMIFGATTTQTTYMALSPAGFLGIGTTTPATSLHVASASSTVRIGTGGANPGCIEIYDAVNSSTINYAYVSSTALVVTTVKPTFCQ